MTARLLKAAWRFYCRRPLQLALAIAGIGLGVAVFVGVALANDSARRAFAQSESALVGRATHQLVGLGGELASATYRDLRRRGGPIVAAPVIETTARFATPTSAVTLTLLGIDPLEELHFRDYSAGTPGPGSASSRLVTERASVLVPPALARELGVAPDDTFELSVDGRPPRSVTIVGLLGDDPYDPEGLNLPLVADIATVAELRGVDTLTRIDLVLSGDDVDAVHALNLAGAALIEAASRDDAFEALSSAFHVNLTALSLLALLVGVFLIYATMSFAVVQRRALFGIYRALGLRRRQLLGAVLLEALALGGIATLLGVALGNALARGLVDLMLRTIGDLYFSTAVQAVSASPLIYVEGVVMGLGMSLVAAALPAIEAGRTSPRAALSRASLERAATRVSSRAARLAFPCLVAGAVALAASSRSLVGAFAGLFLVILAAALVTPAAAAMLLRAAEAPIRAGFGLAGSLAARGVVGAMSRTGVAAAALTVAVATVIGVGLMIDSFRGSVERWLDSTLLADLYADVDGEANAGDPQSAPIDLARLAEIPGVRGLSLLQFTRLPSDAGEVSLRAVEPGPDGWGLTLVAAAGDTVARLEAGEGVVVTESLAYRGGLRVGDEIALPTPGGPAAFPILGVYRDYNTDGGGVLMSMRLYRSHWNDRALDGLGIYLDPAADRAAAIADVQAALGASAAVRLRSTQAIRARSLEVFDQTFRVTEVLRILAGVVAFLGLLSALLAIELDRVKEIAVLRALGFGPRQVAVLALGQTALLGLAAGLLAIPLGLAMAGLLVDVINRRSFGWGMDLSISPEPIALGLALAVVAALLAGVYPALRLGRIDIAAGLREE
jgi:putative ABC transport system permease protein